MPLSNLSEFLDKYRCPNCLIVGKKVNNLSNARYCDEDGCNIGYYFTIPIADISKTSIEAPTCSVCGDKAVRDSAGKYKCLNDRCRVINVEV